MNIFCHFQSFKHTLIIYIMLFIQIVYIVICKYYTNIHALINNT